LSGIRIVRLPAFEQHDAADADRRAREVEGHTGTPGRGHKAAPVRVAAVHRRLDEQ
jgi:hypothetical protein